MKILLPILLLILAALILPSQVALMLGLLGSLGFAIAVAGQRRDAMPLLRSALGS